MAILYSLHSLQHVSGELYGYHQIAVQIHKQQSIVVIGVPFADTKYDFYVLLTIHLGIIFVINQFDAQFSSIPANQTVIYTE